MRSEQLRLPKDITDQLEIGKMIEISEEIAGKLRKNGEYRVKDFIVKVDYWDEPSKKYLVYVSEIVKNGNRTKNHS